MSILHAKTPIRPPYVDLHIHSTASDGSLSPLQIVKTAENVGLRAIAITDHDTVEGSLEALRHQHSTDVEILSGIEISAGVDSGTMHLLGYLIHLDDVSLRQTLKVVQEARANRNIEIIRKLQDLGVDINFDEVSKVSGGGQIGRPHIAQVLVHKGAVHSIDEAFRKFLKKGRPAYIERYRLLPDEAIQTILQAGGVPVLAHPFTLDAKTERTVLQIGSEITKGLGAGANPSVGREAAIEDRERIMESIAGTDMLFITAGMGGGTGTGAGPIVAELAKEMGILTVAVVTKPFPWEGPRRMGQADEGIKELREYVDSLITIPNQKLQAVLGKGTTLLDAFKEANNVLLNAVQGISELITRPGLINVDFADVRTVMSEMGMAMMGSGSATGEDRATDAAERAISSPLLEDVDLSGANGILVNVTAGMDMSIGEFEEVGNAIKAFAADNATVVVGTVIDPDMSGEMRVTVVATGIGNSIAAQPEVSEIKLVKPKQERQTSAPTINSSSIIEEDLLVTQKVSGDEYATANEPEDLKYLDIPAFLRRQND